MKFIVGIGNPGKKYEKTRHNAGFMFLDQYANQHTLKFTASKYEFYQAEGSLEGNPFLLIKPVTYVNLSGNAIVDLFSEYSGSPEDLLVVYDEINLEPGKYKVKLKGSDGGHNGISSIIYSIESENFTRLRIGVGNNFEPGSMADYVLSPFEKDEFERVSKVFETCSLLANEFIRFGVKGLLDANSKLITKDQTIID